MSKNIATVRAATAGNNNRRQATTTTKSFFDDRFVQHLFRMLGFILYTLNSPNQKEREFAQSLGLENVVNQLLALPDLFKHIEKSSHYSIGDAGEIKLTSMGVGLIRFLGSVLQKDTQPTAHDGEKWLLNPRRNKEGGNTIDTPEQINVKFDAIIEAYLKQLEFDVEDDAITNEDIEYVCERANRLSGRLVELFGSESEGEYFEMPEKDGAPAGEQVDQQEEIQVENDKEIGDDLAWVVDEKEA